MILEIRLRSDDKDEIVAALNDLVAHIDLDELREFKRTIFGNNGAIGTANMIGQGEKRKFNRIPDGQ